MRRRITRVAATTAVLAVLALGVPLAFAVARLVIDGEHGELERAALRAASAVSPDYLRGDPIDLSGSGDVAIAVYAPDGRRVAGRGPATAATEVRTALHGSVSRGVRAGSLIDAVPVQQGERTIAAVSATTSRDEALQRTLLWWTALGVAGVLATAVAIAVASRQSRQLAQPLVDLAAAARRLGDGDFSSKPGRSSVAEIDAVAVALARTAERLESQLERERSFAARASHQLRTPLTRLRLELEGGLASTNADAGKAALVIVDQLATVVNDILDAPARGKGEPALDVGSIVEQMVPDWHGALAAKGRPLRVRVHPTPTAAVSPATVRQALHVLLDNALAHGSGAVEVEVREAHGAIAIDVADHGRRPSGVREGLGLSLARSLVEAEGGRIVLSPATATCFTLLIPPATPAPELPEACEAD